MAETKHYGPIIAKNIINCQSCGFAHQSHPPAYNDQYRYYQNVYYQQSEAWFLKELREHNEGLWKTDYEFRLSHFPIKPIIDVGCGSGWFIDYCHVYKSANYVGLYGVEPSKNINLFFQAERFIRLHLSDIKTSGNIHLSLVLEHVPEPTLFLQSLKSYLDGNMLIITPNEFNPLQNLLAKKHGHWFINKDHINYFTPTGLRHCVRRAGYRIIYESSTFPMEIFPFIGLNYIGNDKLGQKLHRFRLKFQNRLGFKAFKLYKKLYDWWGIGRELFFVVTKA